MNRTLFIILFFSGFLGLRAQQADYLFNDNCRLAYNKLIEMDFDSAHILIRKETLDNPDNLMPVLLENYYDFLKIVLFEDEDLFDQSENKKRDRLSLWKTGPKDNPWYLSGQAQIKLQWAFSRVLFDEYFTAATEINSAYHLLEENQEKFPDFLEDNMGIGILHAMIGVVPDQYQWALELFGFYGTIEQGMKEIRSQLENSGFHPFKQEALFYFTFLRLNLQSDSARFTELFDYYRNEDFKDKSPLLSFSKAILLMRIDNDAAILHLLNDYTLYQETHFYYPVFLLGQTLLYQLNDNCEKYLHEYISNYQGHNYKKTALQRLAWWSHINGDKDSYFRFMKRVEEEGNNLLDSDKSALKEAGIAKEGVLPNKELLKARILFDGHYYSQALEEIKKLDKPDLSQEYLLEYHYRMGRIYHEMGGDDLAIEAYQMAINEGEDSERYFAGKAALKIGEIEESRSNYSKAKQAYEKCLELDFSEYRRGIRAKAKAGLQRIEKQ